MGLEVSEELDKEKLIIQTYRNWIRRNTETSSLPAAANNAFKLLRIPIDEEESFEILDEKEVIDEDCQVFDHIISKQAAEDEDERLEINLDDLSLEGEEMNQKMIS